MLAYTLIMKYEVTVCHNLRDYRVEAIVHYDEADAMTGTYGGYWIEDWKITDILTGQDITNIVNGGWHENVFEEAVYESLNKVEVE